MATDTPTPEESGRQQRAFEVYLSLGETRTYQQVAEQMGVAIVTVKRWAGRGNWQAKVLEREAELAKKVASHYAASRLARIERNLKLIHAGLLRLGKGITGGNVKMQLGDLERLIRLEMDLVRDPAAENPESPARNGVVIYLPDNGRGAPPPQGYGELPPDGGQPDSTTMPE